MSMQANTATAAYGWGAALRKRMRPAVWKRGLLFLAGGGLFYTLNTATFLQLTEGLHWPAFLRPWVGPELQVTGGWGWPDWAAFAASLSTVTMISFVWSYHVNFRTGVAWRTAMPNYLKTIAACWVANFSLTMALLQVLPERQKLAILIATAVVAMGKFLVYHYWVFPEERGS